MQYRNNLSVIHVESFSRNPYKIDLDILDEYKHLYTKPREVDIF